MGQAIRACATLGLFIFAESGAQRDGLAEGQNAATAGAADGSADASPIILLAQVAYAPEQLPLGATEGTWSALCAVGTEIPLRKVEVDLRPVEDGIDGRTQLHVHVAGCPKAIALFQGIQGIEPIHTAKIAQAVHAKDVFSVHFRDQTYLFRSHHTLAPSKDYDLSVEYIMQTHRPRREQFLYRVDGLFHDVWKIVWAGDLDGDGRLDLLAETDGDPSEMHLFLSTRAVGGAFVGEVAITAWGGG